MATLNFSLPDDLRLWVEAQVASGGYGNTSEYIRELIRLDRKRKAQERLEALLIQGLESGPAREMTRKDWDELRRKLAERLKAKNPRAAKE